MTGWSSSIKIISNPAKDAKDGNGSEVSLKKVPFVKMQETTQNSRFVSL